MEGLRKKWVRVRSAAQGGREVRRGFLFSPPLSLISFPPAFLLAQLPTRTPVDTRNLHFCSIEKEGQRTLTEVADDTVIRVTAGQERLVKQQEQLHSNYDDVQRSIAFSLRGNVRALHQERIMIDSGRKQLKDMAKAVKEKLGSSS